MRLIDYFDRGADLSLAKAKLGGVKAPKSVDFVAARPAAAVDKVLRKTSRGPYLSGRERKV